MGARCYMNKAKQGAIFLKPTGDQRLVLMSGALACSCAMGLVRRPALSERAPSNDFRARSNPCDWRRGQMRGAGWGLRDR